MAMISILNYMTLYNYISLISLMIGIYLHIRGYSVLKYLLPFIFYTLIIEVFLNYYLSKTYGTSEKMYSYFSFTCALFYLYQYYLHFKEQPWSKYLVYAIFVWILSSLYIFYSAKSDMVFLPYYLGFGLIIPLIFKYFYNMLYIDKYRSVKNEPLFYFSLGLLLFSFTTFPILVFLDVLILHEIGRSTVSTILQYGNVFISAGYLAAVLCTKKSS